MESSTRTVAAATTDVEALLTKELQQLSFEARNKIQEEVHGVLSMAPTETPEMIQKSLNQLEQAVSQLPVDVKPAYTKALAMDSPYVHAKEFRLRFLRAELFDAATAAVRFAKHLNLLDKYFGTEALVRPLRWDDLGKREQEILRVGQTQVLPARDRAGRLVAVHIGSMGDNNTPGATRLRILLYMYSVIAEDVDTQRRGLVAIFVADKQHFERYNGGSVDYQKDLSELMKTMPVRWSAMHTLLPEGPLFKLLQALLVVILIRKNERVRMKFYTGCLSNIETQYKLMGYGIHIQELPVTHSGTIKNKNHIQWIKIRKIVGKERDKLLRHNHHQQQQQRGDDFPWIEHPRVNDVLFRRGGNSNHFGNLEFQQIMFSKLQSYNSTNSHMDKRQIREKIIRLVQDNGGRFLEFKKEYGGWMEITSMSDIHNKVIPAINDLNRTVAARENHQRSESDTRNFLGGSKRRKLDDSCECKWQRSP